jgi:hypothetical protein
VQPSTCEFQPAGKPRAIDQHRQAKGYCTSRGWEIVADYVEPGLSATDDRRPQFQRMIDASKSIRKNCASWGRKAYCCARSSLGQTQKRLVLACPLLAGHDSNV